MKLLIFGIIAFLATWLLLKVQIKFAARLGLIDQPSARKIHSKGMPTSGGLSMVLVLSIVSLTGLVDVDLSVILSIITLAVLGVADDKVDLSHKIKFLVQIMVAAMLVFSGYRIESFYGFLEIYELSTPFSIAISLLLATGIINAISLIDGVDGLCAGYVGVFIATVLVLSHFEMETFNLMVLVLFTLGGFLMVNFYPAKIYMGDVGSLSLGILFYIFLTESMVSPTEGIGTSAIAFVIGAASLPILDTFRLIVTRLFNGKSPFKADKNHLHHLLLELGVKHSIVSILYALMSLLIGWVAYEAYENKLTLGFMALLALCYVVTVALIKLSNVGLILLKMNLARQKITNQHLEKENYLLKRLNYEKV